MIYDRAGPITTTFSCIMSLIYLPKLYLLVDRIWRRGHFKLPSKSNRPWRRAVCDLIFVCLLCTYYMFGEFTWSALQKQEVWLLKVLESNWKYLIFYYPVPHVVCRTTFMKRGVWLLLIWKLTGSPPLMWWISIFFISGYKGIALPNNFMPFFL